MRKILNKEQILKILSDHRLQLNRYGVEQIGLFGSFVRNEDTENSDIDLLVDINTEKKTFRNFLSLAYFWEDILGRKVELVIRQSLSPYIGPHILKSVEYASI